MRGLILKDFLILKKHLRTYSLFLLFYLIMGLAGVFPMSVVTSVLSVVIMMIPLSCFSYDEYARWDRYAAALPLGRRTVTGARYLFTLLLWLIAAALGLLICVFLSISGEGNLAEEVISTLAVLAFSLAVADVMLPLSYRFGPERARPYLYVVLFVPVLILFGADKLGLLTQIPDSTAAGMFLLCLLASLSGLGLSYLISCRIMERKEF